MYKQFISRVRRNHGLEHATIHVLSEKYPNRFSAQGNSTHLGFFLNIYGEIPDQEIEGAAREAHRRMKHGETHLAVHPNCGTALITMATLAALASQAAFAFEMRRMGKNKMSPTVLLNALPAAALAAAVALIAGRPLGMQLQKKYTTDGEMGDLEIAGIHRVRPSLITRFFQLLLGQQNNQNVQSYRIDTIG